MSQESRLTDVPAGGAISKVGDFSERGLARLRNLLKQQYYKGGGWSTPRIYITAGISFVGLYLLFAIVLSILVLPLSAVSGIQMSAAVNGGLVLAAGSLAYAGWGARSDIKDRDKTYQYAERPNPEVGAQAIEYLDSRDSEARANATIALAQAVDNGPGKVVKQSPYETKEIVTKLVSHLDHDHEGVRAYSADALSAFSRDYPGVVMEYAEEIKSAIAYHDSRIRGHLAIALGNLGMADQSRADEFASRIGDIANDDDPEVREAVVVALSGLQSDRALEIIQKLAEDPNPDVRSQANEVLQQYLQQSNGQQPEAEQVNPNQSAGQGQEGDNEFIEQSPDMDFTDIAGMEDLKRRLDEQVIQPFNDSEVYEKFGVGAETGILFHGPPGTGKTYMAKCLAGELGANYISANVGDIESKWMGEGVENIKKMFAEARQNQPCLVFIDEIDAVATDRSSGNQHNDKKKMVNQLLQELSDIDTDDDILVVAATNRPDDIDDAMLRSGRFDSKIEIPKPDEEARWEIFQHHMDAPHESIDREEFVRATSGFTASDMEEITRRAARKAAGRERKTGEDTQVTTDDIYEAIDEIGSEKGEMGQFIRSPPSLDFTDVVGMEELKEELTDKVIDPIENPERYEEFGLGVEHGFLLYGPPGTGKTYISKCLAGELDVNYIEAKGGDLVSKWIGEGAQNVQKMFSEARDNQPCLIFIDEIDALATDRSGGQQSKSERQMVNQFLEELSTINDEDDDVIVIAATNRPNDIDDAMLRTGRLGEKIEVPAPDSSTRVDLFKAHLDAPTGDIDETWVAEQTDGFVASDMEQVATEAARIAMKRVRDSDSDAEVTQEDVEEAVQRVKN